MTWADLDRIARQISEGQAQTSRRLDRIDRRLDRIERHLQESKKPAKTPAAGPRLLEVVV